MSRYALTIVIPTFNEANVVVSSLTAITEALGDLRQHTEIIFADDGADDLPIIIEKFGKSFDLGNIRVMRNPEPIGKGGSIMNAFHSSEGAIVGFLDVDLSVHPRFIHDALRELNGGNHVTIASRVGNRLKSDKSLLKTAMATIFKFAHRTLLFGRGRTFSDTQCGFKFFRRDVAVDLYQDLVALDGLNDLEILIKAVNKGYLVSEIPVPRINDREGKIKLSTILTRETLSLWRIFRKYRLGW